MSIERNILNFTQTFHIALLPVHVGKAELQTPPDWQVTEASPFMVNPGLQVNVTTLIVWDITRPLIGADGMEQLTAEMEKPLFYHNYKSS